eukprot:scaffold12806_cov104-Isochrysis_galbana.AAC.1
MGWPCTARSSSGPNPSPATSWVSGTYVLSKRRSTGASASQRALIEVEHTLAPTPATKSSRDRSVSDLKVPGWLSCPTSAPADASRRLGCPAGAFHEAAGRGSAPATSPPSEPGTSPSPPRSSGEDSSRTCSSASELPPAGPATGQESAAESSQTECSHGRCHKSSRNWQSPAPPAESANALAPSSRSAGRPPPPASHTSARILISKPATTCSLASTTRRTDAPRNRWHATASAPRAEPSSAAAGSPPPHIAAGPSGNRLCWRRPPHRRTRAATSGSRREIGWLAARCCRPRAAPRRPRDEPCPRAAQATAARAARLPEVAQQPSPRIAAWAASPQQSYSEGEGRRRHHYVWTPRGVQGLPPGRRLRPLQVRRRSRRAAPDQSGLPGCPRRASHVGLNPATVRVPRLPHSPRLPASRAPLRYGRPLRRGRGRRASRHDIKLGTRKHGSHDGGGGGQRGGRLNSRPPTASGGRAAAAAAGSPRQARRECERKHGQRERRLHQRRLSGAAKGLGGIDDQKGVRRIEQPHHEHASEYKSALSAAKCVCISRQLCGSTEAIRANITFSPAPNASCSPASGTMAQSTSQGVGRSAASQTVEPSASRGSPSPANELLSRTRAKKLPPRLDDGVSPNIGVQKARPRPEPGFPDGRPRAEDGVRELCALKTSRNTTPHTNSQRSMGSATWSQIPSHAGSGEGGGDDARGEEESIRWGATLQSGGIVCLIVVKCRIQIQQQQLGVESLWRRYERPTVQKPSQIAAD